MAKHPHKILLINKKVWKCQLGGCNFFVHLGLEYVLVGKHAECWGCGEVFEIDEISLKEPKPRCIDCRLSTLDIPTPAPEPITGPTSESERTPEQQREYEKNMSEIFGKNWRSLVK